MDGIKITKVVEELMSLLQKMGIGMGISESVTEGDFRINEMLARVEVAIDIEIEELKEELGSWFVPDWPLYVGS